MYYTNNGTELYQGDMKIGDREATIEEIEAYEVKKELKAKIGKAQALLDSTQFKFGDDYDQKDTPEWLELKAKRQEAREFIRINDVPNP